MPVKMPTPSAHRPHSLSTLCCLIAACGLAPAALAADNPGAHEHGRALLQMAVEEHRIDLMLNSPAHNLAGFEHEARTESEKSQLADINSWLETTPLVNSAAANCRITAAAVELGGGKSTHGDHDHHDNGHDEHDHHQEEHHDHDSHHGEATHREYDVSQQLECDRIESDQEFTSALMERFEGMEELTIEWVSPSGQGSARLTPSKGNFILEN